MAATIGRILLMPKGTYNGTTVYNSLDWVRYNGVSWVCKVDGTVGVVPVEGANWTVMAQDGNVGGNVDWANVNYKPFDDLAVNGGLDVDGSNNLKLDTSYLIGSNIGYDNSNSGLSATTVQLAIDELAGSMGGSTVSWNQIQGSTGATKIAEITINGSKENVYAPSGGGGGASSLDDLTDVSIDTQTLDDGQILAYNNTDGEFQNVDMPQGGHDMISNATLIASMNTAIAEGTTNDDVVSAYGVGTWANGETITLYTTAAQNTDTIGDWEAEGTWETGSRSGWLWHSELHNILADDHVEIEVVFDAKESEVVSLYAYRIDDDVQNGGTDGGAIAIKLNGAIKNASGVKIGVNLKRQRTQVSNFTVLT